MPADSHTGKALLDVLETYPRDELLQVGTDELLPVAIAVLHLQERRQTRLFALAPHVQALGTPEPQAMPTQPKVELLGSNDRSISERYSVMPVAFEMAARISSHCSSELPWTMVKMV